jgi:hypothetical protein
LRVKGKAGGLAMRWGTQAAGRHSGRLLRPGAGGQEPQHVTPRHELPQSFRYYI